MLREPFQIPCRFVNSTLSWELSVILPNWNLKFFVHNKGWRFQSNQIVPHIQNKMTTLKIGEIIFN